MGQGSYLYNSADPCRPPRATEPMGIECHMQDGGGMDYELERGPMSASRNGSISASDLDRPRRPGVS